ncbi:MAG: DUF1624 domain-containing protein [Thermoplasmata archaeon]|nr:DUF1624 domain-containing protein [Thermoplasmata archaeon]
MNILYKRRFWEIDFLRAIAIFMMITFHIVFDIDYFKNYNLVSPYNFWWYFARATATLFLTLVGISLTLSYSRIIHLSKNRDFRKIYIKYIIRGMKIFSWGLLITFITFIFLRKGTILFGILHLIGVSIILAYPLLKFRILNLITGVFFILLGLFISNFYVEYPWLIWLGVKTTNFYTFDYFPVLPWFGVVLIGIFLGNIFYPNYKRSFKLPDLSKNLMVKHLCFLGRHSLRVYLIHQPVLIGVLYMVGMIDISTLFHIFSCIFNLFRI